jgi:phosphate transport system substrate-binding protein
VALDGLSVFTHEGNPIKDLSLEQLSGIFTGKIRNWKEVGGSDAPITVYSRENSSGTYEFFKDHVLKGKDFLASAQTMPGTAALLQAVGNDRNGIGYGGAAYAAGAKTIGVRRDASSKGVEPTEETVLLGAKADPEGYQIWRYLFIYVNPAIDKGEVADYLTWIRSSDGQKAVKDVGYYPLPENLRK